MKKLMGLFLIISMFLFAGKVFAEEEILILFDSSVSMMNKINGQPKYIAAASAAKSVLETMNPQRKVGLRVIGLQLNENILSYVTNPDNMCKATELLNPIARNNVNFISAQLDGLIPLGTTPLTYSIATAVANDFSKNADPKHIILITDGAESCRMDPCRYIKEIMQYRKDIVIDVIAINVTGEDFSQLKCLSDSTDGNIRMVDNQGDMNKAFRTFIQTYQTQYYDPQQNGQNSAKIRFKNYAYEIFK